MTEDLPGTVLSASRVHTKEEKRKNLSVQKRTNLLALGCGIQFYVI